MIDVDLNSIEIPQTRRPDGRNSSEYVRYKAASARRLSWAFLRRNRDFQRACIAVERGLIEPEVAARRYGLLNFRDFRWTYQHGGRRPRYTFTYGRAMYQPSQTADATADNEYLYFRIRAADFDVGELGMRIKMKAIRHELKRSIAVAAPAYNKQLQLKTSGFFELLQLLDLIDAGATDAELIDTISALKLRTTAGQTAELQLQRMKARAQFMCTQGYKELAVVGYAREKRKRTSAKKESASTTSGAGPIT